MYIQLSLCFAAALNVIIPENTHTRFWHKTFNNHAHYNWNKRFFVQIDFDQAKRPGPYGMK